MDRDLRLAMRLLQWAQPELNTTPPGPLINEPMTTTGELATGAFKQPEAINSPDATDIGRVMTLTDGGLLLGLLWASTNAPVTRAAVIKAPTDCGKRKRAARHGGVSEDSTDRDELVMVDP